jgi:HSP20 family molecular chaperone IbpA
MDHRIPVKINTTTQLNERSSRLDSAHATSDIRDKMNQRMREFEDESRRWREQFMSTAPPAIASADYSRPRMFVNFPEFPELNWGSPSQGSLGRSGSGAMFSSSSTTQNNSHKSFIEEDNDGNKKYKLQFDIGDFKPHEIQVRTEGRLLVIKGDHEVHAGSATESKQFNRELTLPEFIEPTTVTSYLCDGILTVDAPIVMDRLGVAGASSANTIQSRRSPFRDQISPSRISTLNTNHYSPSCSSSIVSRAEQSPLSAASGAAPTYRFNLSEFRPEDISITVTDATLNIHAVREEMEPRGMSSLTGHSHCLQV